jgi:hypothetical protein
MTSALIRLHFHQNDKFKPWWWPYQSRNVVTYGVDKHLGATFRFCRETCCTRTANSVSTCTNKSVLNERKATVTLLHIKTRWASSSLGELRFVRHLSLSPCRPSVPFYGTNWTRLLSTRNTTHVRMHISVKTDRHHNLQEYWPFLILSKTGETVTEAQLLPSKR